jgi:hypothetical protein
MLRLVIFDAFVPEAKTPLFLLWLDTGDTVPLASLSVDVFVVLDFGSSAELRISAYGKVCEFLHVGVRA